MLSVMLQALRSHMDTASLDDVTQSMRACFKVLSKIQMPVAYMDVESEEQSDDTEVQSTIDEPKKNQVCPLKKTKNQKFISFHVVTAPDNLNRFGV